MTKRSYAVLFGTILFVAVLVTIAVMVNKRLSAREAVHTFASNAAAPVPVIDAGHGGEDGGAVSSGGIKESAINLDIALKLENIFAFCGIDTVMTRRSDVIVYPADAVTTRQRKNADLQSRARLANQTSNALLISIHQNKYTTSQPHGAQVFYADNSASQTLAEKTQELLQKIDPANKRQAVQIPDSIYLMRVVKCPAILVECGFLSNAPETGLLVSREYQLKLSMAVASGYFAIYNNISGET